MTLGDVAARLVEIKADRADLKTLDDELSKENKRLMAEAVAAMDESGIDDYTIDDTAKISRRQNVRGNIENAADFFFFLADKKDESLGMIQLDPTMLPPNMKKIIKANPDGVKLAIAWNRLAAYLKDVCDPLDAETWPPGVKVDFWEDVRVTVKK